MSAPVLTLVPDLQRTLRPDAVGDLVAEIHKEFHAAFHDASSAVQHAYRCGHLLIEAKKHHAHGTWLAWLAAHCPMISERTAQSWMRVARKYDPQSVADLPLRALLKLVAGPAQAHNSGECEWNTPKHILDAARAVLGPIDLDPATNPAANEIVQARTCYTRQNDGLTKEWRARTCWMNPPYAQPFVTEFCGKLADAVRSGAVGSAIVLLNNGTDTQYFGLLAREASALCFPTGRVPFWKPGKPGKFPNPLQGQMLVYLGPKPTRFCEVFSTFGVVAELWRGGANA